MGRSSLHDAVRRLPLAARAIDAFAWWRDAKGICTSGSRLHLAVAAFSERLSQRLVGRTLAVKLLASDASIVVRTASSDRIAFWGVFLNREYDLDYGVAEPKVIVDAGANIGLTSVFYALRFPTARIVALEPDHENFALLLSNVAAYQAIVPLKGALWHELTSVEVRDPGEGAWGFRVSDSARGAEHDTSHRGFAETTTVTKLLEENGGWIDVLKLDIEGSEWNVLQHASDWIDRVGALVVEPHTSIHPDCREVFAAATSGLGEHEERHGLLLARR